MGARGRLNLALKPNYFIFMGYFRNMEYNLENKTPLIHLSRPSASRQSAPVLVQCFDSGERGGLWFECNSLLLSFE